MFDHRIRDSDSVTDARERTDKGTGHYGLLSDDYRPPDNTVFYDRSLLYRNPACDLAPAVHRSIDLSFYILIKDHGICLEKIILLPCIKPPAGKDLAFHLISHVD